MGAKAKMMQSLRASTPAAAETSLDRALSIIKGTSGSASAPAAKSTAIVSSHHHVQSSAGATATAASGAAFLANAVHFPNKSSPIHLLSGGGPQPWELMPLKAAAVKVYPNIFNTSCMFFGSLQRDVLHHRPSCLLRPTRLGIDLAKIMRNLGVIGGFEIWQRPGLALRPELRWPVGAEPEDELFLRLFPQCYLKLHLRWDQHRPLWMSPSTPMTEQPTHTGEALPLSTTNISKASRPVLMTRQQLEVAREAHPSGIFVCYHDELGLITDAVADLHKVSAVLVLAHVGLPFSQAIQVRGALRVKYLREREGGRQPQPLTKWNMLDQLRDSVESRRRAVTDSSIVHEETMRIKSDLKAVADEDARLIAESEAESEQLGDELAGWLLQNRLPGLSDHNVSSAFRRYDGERDTDRRRGDGASGGYSASSSYAGRGSGGSGGRGDVAAGGSSGGGGRRDGRSSEDGRSDRRAGAPTSTGRIGGGSDDVFGGAVGTGRQSQDRSEAGGGSVARDSSSSSGSSSSSQKPGPAGIDGGMQPQEGRAQQTDTGGGAVPVPEAGAARRPNKREQGKVKAAAKKAALDAAREAGSADGAA